jgi:hypothetical protein
VLWVLASSTFAEGFAVGLRIDGALRQARAATAPQPRPLAPSASPEMFFGEPDRDAAVQDKLRSNRLN